MEAVASTLADVAMVIAALALWVVVAVAGHEFFFSAPRQRKAEDGYAVMPAEQRTFPIRSTREARAAVTAGPRDAHRR